MAKPNARDTFLSAEAFMSALGILLRTAPEEKRYGIVLGTLEPFILELYLKCLIMLETGDHKRGHDLYKLFQFLNPQTQRELGHAFDEYVARFPSFINEAKINKWPVKLEPLLIRGRRAFEEFRYLHEHKDGTTLWGVKGLVIGVRERILQLHPEWEET